MKGIPVDNVTVQGNRDINASPGLWLPTSVSRLYLQLCFRGSFIGMDFFCCRVVVWTLQMVLSNPTCRQYDIGAASANVIVMQLGVVARTWIENRHCTTREEFNSAISLAMTSQRLLPE